MTFCKTLEEKTLQNGMKIQCVENYDKYSSTPYYEIVYSMPNWEYAKSIRTAKTTWQKKFKEVVHEMERK